MLSPIQLSNLQTGGVTGSQNQMGGVSETGNTIDLFNFLLGLQINSTDTQIELGDPKTLPDTLAVSSQNKGSDPLLDLLLTGERNQKLDNEDPVGSVNSLILAPNSAELPKQGLKSTESVSKSNEELRPTHGDKSSFWDRQLTQELGHHSFLNQNLMSTPGNKGEGGFAEKVVVAADGMIQATQGNGKETSDRAVGRTGKMSMQDLFREGSRLNAESQRKIADSNKANSTHMQNQELPSHLGKTQQSHLAADVQTETRIKDRHKGDGFQELLGNAELGLVSAKPINAADSSHTTSRIEDKNPVQVHQIMEKAQVLVSQGGGTMKVILSPPELGQVEIQVKTRGKNVEIDIKSDNDQARSSIQSQVAELKSSLEAQDLVLSKVEVHVHRDNESMLDSNLLSQNQGQSNFQSRQPNPFSQESRFTGSRTPSTNISAVRNFGTHSVNTNPIRSFGRTASGGVNFQI